MPDSQDRVIVEDLVTALDGLIQECEYSASSGLPFDFSAGHWTQLGKAKALLATYRMNTPELPHVLPPNVLTERMELIYETLKSLAPPDYFFFFLMGPLGPNFDGKQANFITNAKREQIIKVMKEFLIRNGSDEEWMKHME